MTKATVYMAPQCPHSEKVKTFLKENNVDIEEKCVLDSTETIDELKKVTGQLAIPATVIGDDVFIGYDRRTVRKLKRKLGV
ncbi:MAG: glutaredoxin family protein [Candidatus Thorarchaeota archaeon]